jgi:Transposase
MRQQGVPQGLLEQNFPLNDWRCAWRTRTTAWAGIDIGKTHHWICAVDADGRALVSVKVANIEADIVAAVATLTDLADQAVWAVRNWFMDIASQPAKRTIARVSTCLNSCLTGG